MTQTLTVTVVIEIVDPSRARVWSRDYFLWMDTAPRSFVDLLERRVFANSRLPARLDTVGRTLITNQTKMGSTTNCLPNCLTYTKWTLVNQQTFELERESRSWVSEVWFLYFRSKTSSVPANERRTQRLNMTVCDCAVKVAFPPGPKQSWFGLSRTKDTGASEVWKSVRVSPEFERLCLLQDEFNSLRYLVVRSTNCHAIALARLSSSQQNGCPMFDASPYSVCGTKWACIHRGPMWSYIVETAAGQHILTTHAQETHRCMGSVASAINGASVKELLILHRQEATCLSCLPERSCVTLLLEK